MSFTVPPGATGPSGSDGAGQAMEHPRQPSASELNYIIYRNGLFPSSPQPPFLGEICLFAGNLEPAWLDFFVTANC